MAIVFRLAVLLGVASSQDYYGEQETLTIETIVGGAADVDLDTPAHTAAIRTRVAASFNRSESKVLVRIAPGTTKVVAIVTFPRGAAVAARDRIDAAALAGDIEVALGISGATVAVPTVETDIEIVLGAVGPITSFDESSLATLIAFDLDFRANYDAEVQAKIGDPMIQIDNLNPRLRLRLQVGNSNSEVALGVQTALDFWYEQNGMQSIMGLIGEAHSAISMPVASIGMALKKAQVSFGSTSSQLSQKERYGYFFRTIPEDSIQSAALWKWIETFNVPKVLSLYAGDGSYASGLNEGVVAYAAEAGKFWKIQSIPVELPIYDKGACNIESSLEAASSANRSGIKFIMVFMVTEQWGCFADQAIAVGMHGEGVTGYQWIGSEAMSAQLPAGFMQFQPQSQDPAMWPKFSDLWSRLNESDITGTASQNYYKVSNWHAPWSSESYTFDSSVPDPSVYAGYTFDAGYVFMFAFNKLLETFTLEEVLASGSEHLLLEQMRLTDFSGLSGNVTFNDRQDRVGDYQLMNIRNCSWDAIERGCLRDETLKPVQVGTFYAATGALALTQDLVWAPGVELCPDGSFDCVPCPSDQVFVDSIGTCVCKAGFWIELGVCVECGVGFFSAAPGSNMCDECVAGRFGHSVGLTACERCSIGAYANTTGSTRCTKCPATFTTIGEGSESIEDCVCEQGMSEASDGSGRCVFCMETFVPQFDDPMDRRKHTCGCPPAARFDQRSSECVSCEDHLECPGGYKLGQNGTDTTVKVSEGYMTLPDAPFSVYSCVSRENCPGARTVQSLEMCNNNIDRHFPRCGVCQKGAFVTEDSCEPCGDYSVALMCLKGIFTFLTQWAVVVQVYLRCNRPQTSAEGVLGSMATFVQTLQVVSKLDLKNPPMLLSFYRLLDTLTFSGFFVRFRFKFDCIVQHNFRFSIYQQAMTPLIIFLNIGLLQAVFYLRARRKLNRDLVHNTVGLIFTGLFVLLVSQSLSLFYTVKMPNGRLMVVSFPELEYGSTDWLSVIPVNLFSTLLYGVGTVSYVTHAVLTAPRRAAAEPGFMARFRFCFGTKRPDRWWWVLVHLAFGVCVNLLQVMLPADIIQAKVCSSLICTFSFTMIVFSVWPFKFLVVNWVETMFKFDVVILLSLATSFIDTSKLNDEQLDRVNTVWGYLILALVVSTFMFATCLLFKHALTFAEPIGISNVKSARVVWQLRDVAFAMLFLPESTFAKRLSLIEDQDTVLLQQATDRIIQIILGQQASVNLSRQRLLPGNDYQVWDHSKNVIDTLARVRSGELQARLEKGEHLRARAIQVANAMYASAADNLERVEPITITSNSSLTRKKDAIAMRHELVKEVFRSGYRTEEGLRARAGFMGWADRITKLLVSPYVADHITPDEFKQLLSATLGLTMPDEDADAIFAVIDCKSSGWITSRDITGFLTGMAEEDLVDIAQDFLDVDEAMLRGSSGPSESIQDGTSRSLDSTSHASDILAL